MKHNKFNCNRCLSINFNLTKDLTFKHKFVFRNNISQQLRPNVDLSTNVPVENKLRILLDELFFGGLILNLLNNTY